MRVLVIGSTGVLGREAVGALLTEGHRVSGLASGLHRMTAVRRLGIHPVHSNVFDSEALVPAFRGHDAVVNLATRIPPGKSLMWNRKWAENNRLRADASLAVARAAQEAGIEVLVQEGVSLVYADGGDAVLDERALLDPAGPTKAAATAHRNAATFHGDGRRSVRLRIGTLHGDDAISRFIIDGASGRGPAYFGSADGWLTAIHPEDAGAGVAAALTAPDGVYNLGAEPVRKRDFGRVIATVAGVPQSRGVPKALTIGFLSVLARSHRVSSTAFSEATGWRPKRTAPAPDWFPTREQR